MGRSPFCSKVGLKRGPWSAEEDTLLSNYIQLHGEGYWKSLPQNAGLLRCGKSCRLRWMNYLRPGIKRGNISPDEEDLIFRLHKLLGNRWSLIAGRLPGRTDNEIKNHWNTHLLKKLNNAGTEPKANRETSKPPKQPKKQKQAARPPPPKTTVYAPKPIRVSSDFPISNSYDSLLISGSVSSSSDQSGDNNNVEKDNAISQVPGSLLQLLENDEPDYHQGIMGVYYGEEDADFLNLPFTHHSDACNYVNMLEKVYDEYLQLLH